MRGLAALRRIAAPLFAGCLVLATACAWFVTETGLPGVPVEAEVEILAERYEFLDARVETGGEEYRFFFPATAECRAVLADPDSRFVFDGPFGTLRSPAQERCSAVGVLSLAAWRARQGRVARREGSRSLLPRDRVEYRVVYQDEDLFIASGRFRIAGMIGWPGGYDSLAVFPASEACAGLKRRSTAAMEFKPAGEPVFSVLDEGTRCPVLGFAQSPAGPGAAEGEAQR